MARLMSNGSLRGWLVFDGWLSFAGELAAGWCLEIECSDCLLEGSYNNYIYKIWRQVII